MATIGADWDPGCFALRYGDLLEELDLGVAGGGIKMSDRGSGDIDPASELSLLYGRPKLIPGVGTFTPSFFDF